MSLDADRGELHDAVGILELEGDPVGFESFGKAVERIACVPENLAL